jgi:hypothetical protein
MNQSMILPENDGAASCWSKSRLVLWVNMIMVAMN